MYTVLQFERLHVQSPRGWRAAKHLGGNAPHLPKRNPVTYNVQAFGLKVPMRGITNGGITDL